MAAKTHGNRELPANCIKIWVEDPKAMNMETDTIFSTTHQCTKTRFRNKTTSGRNCTV